MLCQLAAGKVGSLARAAQYEISGCQVIVISELIGLRCGSVFGPWLNWREFGVGEISSVYLGYICQGDIHKKLDTVKIVVSYGALI